MEISFFTALIPGVDRVLVEPFRVSITDVTLEESQDGESSVCLSCNGESSERVIYLKYIYIYFQ